jgi:glycosyltransferase involved in cell wall biosynthesis
MSVYNTEDYLKQAIESVVEQTYTNFELIIVNDGSTDNSGEIVDSYAERDNRIVVIHKENSGLSDSRNIALKKVTGDYVGFIDSDDWYEPNYLEQLVDYIEKENLDIVICGYFLEYKNKTVTRLSVDKPTTLSREEGLREIIADKLIKSYVWNKLFKKELITDEMPVSYMFEDYATVFKWFVKANKTGILNVPLYHYRQRGGSIVNERNITNILHFFIAECDRTKYIIEHKIIDGMYEWLRTKLITTTIGTSKDIARYAPTYADYKKHRDMIVSDSMEFLPCKNLNLKKRYRLWLLLHYPRLFYINVNISLWFQFKKRKNIFN